MTHLDRWTGLRELASIAHLMAFACSALGCSGDRGKPPANNQVSDDAGPATGSGGAAAGAAGDPVAPVGAGGATSPAMGGADTGAPPAPGASRMGPAPGGATGVGGSAMGSGTGGASGFGGAGGSTVGSPGHMNDGGAGGSTHRDAGGCAPGFQDCNGDPSDGCEVDTNNDVYHCGACGNACSTNGVSARSCVAGSCAPRCQTYRGDCSHSSTVNDGCETDLQLSANCGACGHDCGRGDCRTDGRCGPVTLVAQARGTSRAAVTANTVYWPETSADGATTRLNQMARTGGPSSIVFESARPFVDIAQANGSLYIPLGATKSMMGALVRLEGSTPREIVTDIVPVFVATTSDAVYWTDGVDGAVHRAGFGGEQPTTVSPQQLLPFELTASGDAVFAATTGGLMIKVSGSTFSQLKTTPQTLSTFVAIDGATAYAWMSDGNGATLGRFDTALSASPTEGFTEPTANNIGKGLAAAAGYVYFAREDGIYRFSERHLAVEKLMGTNGFVVQLLISEGTLFWVEVGADRTYSSIGSVKL